MEKSSLEKTIILTFGRLFGAILTFAIPVFLSRFLSLEEYGLYKLIMLLQGTLMFILPLGIDGGLFYFIRSDPEKHHIYGFNVTMATFLLGLVSGLLIYWKAAAIGHWVKQEEFANYRLAFCSFLCLSLCSNHLQVYFIYLDRLKWTMLIEFFAQLFKASAVVFGFYFANSLNLVLWLLTGVALVQALILFIYDGFGLIKMKATLSIMLKSIVQQIQYGVPLGLSNIIIHLMDFDRLLISALFGVREFTIYAVGCFKIPFISSIEATLADYMGLGMVEAKRTEMWTKFRELWRSTFRMIFMMQVPLNIFLAFFATEVIITVYSDQYRESGLIFAFFTLSSIFNSDKPDMIFRALRETKKLFLLQAIFGLMSISFIALGAYKFGLLGAICGRMLAHFLGISVKLAVYKRLLHVPLREIYDWPSLIGILAISVLSAGLLKQLYPLLPFPGVLRIILLAGCHAILVIASAWILGFIKNDEKLECLARGKFYLSFLLRLNSAFARE